jgi:hypothetical protein
MAWLVKQPRWFRGTPAPRRGSRKTPSKAFLLCLPAGSREGEDLSHTLWNRAEKRRQREHARAKLEESINSERIEPRQDLDPMTGRPWDEDAERRGWTVKTRWVTPDELAALNRGQSLEDFHRQATNEIVDEWRHYLRAPPTP